jgi:hypothetical protein
MLLKHGFFLSATACGTCSMPYTLFCATAQQEPLLLRSNMHSVFETSMVPADTAAGAELALQLVSITQQNHANLWLVCSVDAHLPVDTKLPT